MANLRANTVCGSGGRNAIDGSVVFNGQNSYLKVDDHSDLALGTGDFTIETWVYFTSTGTYQSIIDFRGAGNGAFPFIVRDTDGDLYYFVNSGKLIDNVPARADNSWHHIAVVRSSGTTKFYLNGVEAGSASDSTTYLASNDPFIGASDSAANDLFGILSNLRITKSALYTSTFTPPEKLTVVDNTVLLCCQDSDDPTQEETGKTITGYGSLSAPNINLVPNGDFTNGTTSWTAGGSNNHSVTGTVMRVSNDSSTNGRSTGSAFDTVDGAVYRIRYSAVNSSSATFRIEIREANGAGSEQAFQATSAGPKEYTFTATESQHSVVIYAIGSGTSWAEYANIRVEAVTTYANAPKVLPPVGVDEGVVFDGDTKVNTQGYMYFPTGDTSQRGRGRGLLGGSNDGSPFSDSIQYINIQSQGNSVDFASLTSARSRASSYASSTRGIWGGGNPKTNIIDYVTITTTANATDFGDLTVARRFCSGTSSETRGLTAGGNEASPASPYPSVDVIDYTTIASVGNATDFGNLSGVRSGLGVLSSTTRAVFGGGYVNGAPAGAINIIDYVTIATTGNAADFGDLSNTRRYLAAVSSNTRGVFGSGSTPSQNNTIDFITIATTGNATDFGDATIANEHRAGISNSIRGVWAGSGSPAAGNTIDYVTIATTGDAKDFGDTRTNMAYSAGCSDSHGGLS